MSRLDVETFFDALAESGTQTQEQIRQLDNRGEKALPPFGVERMAKLVGCTANHIRNMEKAGRVQAPESKEIVQQGRGGPKTVKRRAYDLRDVNHYRDALGTRPNDATGAVRVVFSNQKGGVGKSTTSVHFAQYCALTGYRVLLVDLDPQASTTSVFGYIPDLDIEDEHTLRRALMEDPDHISEVIRPTYWDGLDLVPSQLLLQNVDFGLAGGGRDDVLGPNWARLDSALARIERLYDVIVIDTPPSMGILNFNAVFAAHYLIVPMAPSMFDISSSINYCRVLAQLADSLRQMEAQMNLRRFNVLVTRNDGGPEHLRAAQVIRAIYREHVLVHQLMQTAEVQKSANDRKTVFEIDKPRGSKETYRRALDLISGVCEEILTNIRTLWLEDLSLTEQEPLRKGA